MSLSLTQFTRSLKVYASAYDIPSPYVLTTGTQVDFPECEDFGCYVASDSQFKTKGVSVGDIVYVYDGITFQFVTVVTRVESETVIWTADSIEESFNFTIYQQSALSGLGNQGCFLMSVANGLNVAVVTLSGDVIEAAALSANDVLPVQIRKITSTSDNNSMYALW